MASPVPSPVPGSPVQVPDVVARKGSGTPLVMITAYDAPSARAVDGAS
jgi:hypothetical protein